MIGIFLYNISISCHSCNNSIKFAQVINMLLLIRRELFYIVQHEEIFSHNRFPQLQMFELYSSYSNNCAVSFHIYQIYEDKHSSRRY